LCEIKGAGFGDMELHTDMELWRAQLGRGSVDAVAFAPHGMTVVAACEKYRMIMGKPWS